MNLRKWDKINLKITKNLWGLNKNIWGISILRVRIKKGFRKIFNKNSNKKKKIRMMSLLSLGKKQIARN